MPQAAHTDPREPRISDAQTRALFDKFSAYSFSVETLRKKTLSLKRALTAIRNEAGELRTLMDDEETEAIGEALRVLDRWIGKAERAHKEGARVQKAKEAHFQQRKAEAKRLLLARLPAADWRQQIVIANTLHTEGRDFGSFVGNLIDEIQWIAKFAHNGVPAIRSAIGKAFDNKLDAVANSIAYGDAPVASRVDDIVPRMVAAMKPEACATCITEIEEIVARKSLEAANPNAGKAPTK